MVKKIILTGAAGFIGHHVAEHFLRSTDWHIIIIDKLTYASKGLERLRSNNLLNSPRVSVFTFDLSNTISDGLYKEIEDAAYLVHMAADTHVDNSIEDPVPFVTNNYMSTLNILELSRKLQNLEKIFYFSTDEVFGPAHDNVKYKEWDVHNPTNPYSASKSAGENLALSYKNTYKIPLVIVNVMNAFGERQHIEKFIPKCIQYILEEKVINIHASSDLSKIGSRFYIHARNIASALLFLISNAEIGEKYNITGETELSNLDIASKIATIMKKTLKYKIVDAETDRAGHDIRYALCGEKLKSLGWIHPLDFERSLEKTILWTLANRSWLDW